MSVADVPGDDARSFVSWLSRRDLVTMIERCIEIEDVDYEVLFAASGNKWKIYDTPRAWRILGFEPRDDAENFR